MNEPTRPYVAYLAEGTMLGPGHWEQSGYTNGCPVLVFETVAQAERALSILAGAAVKQKEETT